LTSTKEKLLHLIPYQNFVPPKNGGALRCYHLAVSLTEYFDVTVLTYQDKESMCDSVFDKISVINPRKQTAGKGLLSKWIKALRYRWYLRTIQGPAEAAVLDFYPVLNVLSKTEHFDFVLMEHLSTSVLGKRIKQLFPKVKRIADQHNVDHLLHKQHHDLGQAKHRKNYELLKLKEEQLHRHADFLLACSNQDADILAHLNLHRIKTLIVPNGTTIKKSQAAIQEVQQPRLLFCGSLDYDPNKNGLLWFFVKAWPIVKVRLPEIRLTVIGRNGQDIGYEPLKKDPRINFIGEVDQVDEYYLKSHVAIVPLFEGSGTRLKILEAMSFGVPVVSTTIGAEGIAYQDRKNIIIADQENDFVEAIVQLIEKEELRLSIASKALELVSTKYSWEIIAQNFIKDLKEPIK
jgi:polysaccharide biosynthesis protein PslH